VISPKGSGLAQRPGGRGAALGAAALLQWSQFAVFVVLILLTVGAWSLTIIQAQSMTGSMNVAGEHAGTDNSIDAMSDMTAMDGMVTMPDTEPAVQSSAMAHTTETGWSLAGLAAFEGAWAVMMSAMMLPAVAPMVLLYRAIADKSMPSETAFISTWILVIGCLLVWTAVGAGVYALVRLGADVAGRVGALEGEPWPPLVLGTILVVAGLFQFTPLKHACLRQCQSPFGFIMSHWRNGSMGALRMGLVHGLYCLGCCWALFAVLVAAGVMSLAWMLLLTLVVFAEKVLPMGRRTAYGVGVALLVLGILVAGGRVAMPGLA
jgi:predicted metal-binding membrane protein